MQLYLFLPHSRLVLSCERDKESRRSGKRTGYCVQCDSGAVTDIYGLELDGCEEPKQTGQ